MEDVRREWEEGILGMPPLQELEEKWGALWRPSSAQKVAFCRRKVVIDELTYLSHQGLSSQEAVAKLETRRGRSSLRQLIDSLTA
mgnify:CR=1 FL=1